MILPFGTTDRPGTLLRMTMMELGPETVSAVSVKLLTWMSSRSPGDKLWESEIEK